MLCLKSHQQITEPRRFARSAGDAYARKLRLRTFRVGMLRSGSNRLVQEGVP